MGALDDAIREHLELKRRHGASDDEIRQAEAEALGPARRGVPVPEPDVDAAGMTAPGAGVDAPPVFSDDVPPPPAPDSAVHDAPPPPPGLSDDEADVGEPLSDYEPAVGDHEPSAVEPASDYELAAVDPVDPDLVPPEPVAPQPEALEPEAAQPPPEPVAPDPEPQ